MYVDEWNLLVLWRRYSSIEGQGVFIANLAVCQHKHSGVSFSSLALSGFSILGDTPLPLVSSLKACSPFYGRYQIASVVERKDSILSRGDNTDNI